MDTVRDKKLLIHVPLLSKSYFVSVTSAGHNHEFKRHVYKHIDPVYPLVFLYIIWETDLLLLEHFMALQ